MVVRIGRSARAGGLLDFSEAACVVQLATEDAVGKTVPRRCSQSEGKGKSRDKE